MLPPEPQLRLMQIAACARADREKRISCGASIPLGLREVDRLFETTLLISEAALAASVLHGIDWVIARPPFVKKIAV